MRQIGIYYAFWTHEWDVDYLPFIKKVKKVGYDILEANGGYIVDWPEQRRLDLAQSAKDEGITLTYGLGMKAEYDVSSPDEATRLNGMAFIRKMIEAVGRMGGGIIEGSTYCSWPRKLKPGESKQAYIDQSYRSMIEASKIAEDNQVTLNMEVLNRFEQFMFNTCAEILPFVKAINSPSVGLLLDTFHMNIEEDSITDAIIQAGSYLKGFHAGETNRKPVGFGRMDWRPIRKALDEINYKGPVVQEPFIMDGGQVGQDISVWRSLIKNPDLDELAAQSASFMRETLA